MVDGGKIASTARTLTRDGLSSGSTAVPSGSIVLSTRAPIGYAAETTSETAFNQGCRGLVPRVELDLRYFRYQLLARRGDLVALGQGSTFRELSSDALAAFKVSCPPLSEQRRNADFLDVETARIDALIEKKQQLLSLLSDRRQAVVDEAIDSTAGQSLPLRRVVEAFIDYRGATPEKADEGIPLVTASNVSDGEVDFSLAAQFITDETYDEWMRRGFPAPGDVLLTTEAPLGEVAMIDKPRVALAQRIILLKPDRGRVDPEFLYTSLRSTRVQADLLSRASGSTVWGIRADRLADVRLVVPSLSDQRRIVERSRQVEQQYRRGRDVLRRQATLLSEHRQALVTAAVTGKLNIATAPA